MASMPKVVPCATFRESNSITRWISKLKCRYIFFNGPEFSSVSELVAIGVNQTSYMLVQTQTLAHSLQSITEFWALQLSG